MKAPIKWLREYVDIDMTAEEYANKMVMTGTGVEEVTDVAGFTGVVAGRVLSCEKHPDSDHLSVCLVDVGSDEPVTIVCGAPNVAKGQLVPVALSGAHLPGGVVIKKGKLRGVVSNGMICSGPELGIPEGLYPHCGDKGILVINEDYAPGTDAREILGVDDTTVDFEILANRPDCLSIWNLARETSAVLDERCVMPEIQVEEAGEEEFGDYAQVKVLDDELCPRYCARVIKNVKIAPSPMWMRKFLHAAGVRPINNIVDITNFVMLETGHPMHAFDLDKVKDHMIIVRRANKDETLTTLDGKLYDLNESMLVIADHEKATGLAGVMGGEESEITENTKEVLFEAAAFNYANIRMTSRALGIRTEASGRFEKGVAPATTMEALERACMLVNMLECGEVVKGSYDHYPNPVINPPIKASVEKINSLISTNLTGEEMADILQRLFFDVALDGDMLTATAPDWRTDIDTFADLAEEILRMNGYEHIPSTLMVGETMAGMRSENQIISDKIKRGLVAMGFFEALNFSFISPKWLTVSRLDDVAPIVLQNPLGEDTSVMRTTLIPSMLNTLSTNINRGNPEGRLFELSQVFIPAQANELPNEKTTVCLGMYGDKTDFYSIKDACCCLLATFGIEAKVVPGRREVFHPGRKAILTADGVEIGSLGEIHPDVAEAFGIEGTRVYAAQLDVAAVMAASKPLSDVRPLPKFPSVNRDLALVMDKGVCAGPVMDAMKKAGGKTLESIALFDIYTGAQVGLDNKSLAFTLNFRAMDRTLTEAEVNKSIDSILDAVSKQFGAKLR
ncbi:MAG: phenylalanine--tRNA ligase subunit beta [Clostridia bacterium]|nr:phenylalanine--tRNA ligase subunit beta [Clostridia bacterium]